MANVDMNGDRWRSSLPAAYRIKLVTDAWEYRGALDLRRAVFCEEQGVFAGNDTDHIDQHALPIVAVSYNGGMPDEIAGTVRIHEEEPGVWCGSRLAVHQTYRRAAVLGPALIRLAVTTAHARGAHRFIAHVQKANVPLFHRLHWRTIEEEELHGRPHHFMQADLEHYPPYPHGECGFLAMPGGAA